MSRRQDHMWGLGREKSHWSSPGRVCWVMARLFAGVAIVALLVTAAHSEEMKELQKEMKELKKALDKKPKWAEGLAGDVMSSLVWIDKVYNEVVDIRGGQNELPAKIRQEVELKLRDHIRLMNEMLDNREFNSAPAVVSIEAVDGSKFNPKNWFEKNYVLRPFCEREGRVHPVDFVVPFNKPREWWVKTAPRLSMAVKVLSAGVQIACEGLPLGET